MVDCSEMRNAHSNFARAQSNFIQADKYNCFSNKICGCFSNSNIALSEKTLVNSKKTSDNSGKRTVISEIIRSNIEGLTINNEIRTIYIDWKVIYRGWKASDIELCEGNIRQHVSSSEKQVSNSKIEVRCGEKPATKN